jgi:hypothetical protein
MYPISTSMNSTPSGAAAHQLALLGPASGSHASGGAGQLQKLEAIEQALPSIARALEGEGGRNVEVFHANLADQNRDALLGSTLNGAFRWGRDTLRGLTGPKPISAVRSVAAEALVALGQQANVRVGGARQKRGGETAGVVPARGVGASRVNKGVSVGGLKGSLSRPLVFEVSFALDHRFLSITTSCGAGRVDVSVATPDGRPVQRCGPMHPRESTASACLIDRRAAGNEALERLHVTVEGTRDEIKSIRLNMKALSGEVRRPIEGYGAQDAGGKYRDHLATGARRRPGDQHEPSHGALSLPPADDICVRACPPRGSERLPVLLNDLVRLSPSTVVEVPAQWLANGVRAENLVGHLFDRYSFKLELPRVGSLLHLSTSCSSSPYVFMRLFTPDGQWIDEGRAFGPRRNRSQVAVLDLGRPDLSGLTHVNVELNAADDFSGLNFDAKIV